MTAIPREASRSLGIPTIAEAPWGTHFCQFFRNRQDLIDILVPYFREGLQNNEFCVWVTSDPLQTTDAIEAMHAAVPGFDDALVKGQIKFRGHDDNYGDSADAEQVVANWLELLAAARAEGFDGMRATGYIPWLDKTGWRDFTKYEAALDEAISTSRIIGMCGYNLETLTAAELIDVLKNHQLALVRREDDWSVIEPAERTLAYRLAAQARERQQLARELNDSIVQGLVATEMLYDLGETEQARNMLLATSRETRQLVGQLLEGPLRPGAARSGEPARLPDDEPN